MTEGRGEEVTEEGPAQEDLVELLVDGARYGDSEDVQAALDAGVNVNAQDEDSRTGGGLGQGRGCWRKFNFRTSLDIRCRGGSVPRLLVSNMLMSPLLHHLSPYGNALLRLPLREQHRLLNILPSEHLAVDT